mgnify:CR=1 FL=1
MLNALIAIRGRRPIPHSSSRAISRRARGGARGSRAPSCTGDPSSPTTRRSRPRHEEAPADAALLGREGAHVRVLAHHREPLERNARGREPGAAQELSVRGDLHGGAPRGHLRAATAFLQCTRFTDGAQRPPEGARIQQHAILKVLVTTKAQLAPRQRQSHAMTSILSARAMAAAGSIAAASERADRIALRRREAVSAARGRARRVTRRRGSARRPCRRVPAPRSERGRCRGRDRLRSG